MRGRHEGGAPGSVELVLVCGPWGSGTTSVAGLLAQLGMNGLPPFFTTVDERTPNSYESLAFRAAVREIALETTLSLTAPPRAIVECLVAFRERILRQEHGAYAGEPIFLKYPLSALLIPAICEVFRTRLVCVLRPLADIEATRRRRGWGAHTGAQGAQILYDATFRAVVEHRGPAPLMMRFADVIEAPVAAARELARFAGLKAEPGRVEEAAAFVRRG